MILSHRESLSVQELLNMTTDDTKPEQIHDFQEQPHSSYIHPIGKDLIVPEHQPDQNFSSIYIKHRR